MWTHVSRTVSSCFAVLCQLHSIRWSVLPAVIQSLVLSRLDYGNATLAGLPGNQLNRLQSVMTSTAWLVWSVQKYEPIMPLLHDFHWLPVCEQIEFKLTMLVFCCLHRTALPYLGNELCHVADIDARRWLQSASTSALVTLPSCRSTIGDWSFFITAPRTRNSLPSSVTASETLGIFKCRLKTHLFVASLN